MNLILVSISFFLGIFCIQILRRYDIHETEPIGRMAAVVIFGGIMSIIITSIFYYNLDNAGISDIENSWGALFVIGPVEEGAKLLALIVCFLFIKNAVDEPTDGLVYMSCVALGFSLIENFSYAVDSYDPLMTILMRLLTTTPLHIASSVFMGLAVYMIMKTGSGWGFLGLSFLWAVLLHGIWDLMVFNSFSWFFFIGIMYFSYLLVQGLMGFSTAISPFRISLKDFIYTYKDPVREKGIECIKCGNTEDKESFRFGRIYIQKCPQCQSYLTNKASLFYMFYHFGSTFKNLAKEYKMSQLDGNEMTTLFKSNYIDVKKETAYFDLEELSSALDEFSHQAIEGIPRWLRRLAKVSF